MRQALHVQAVQEEGGLWLALHPQVGSAYTYDIPSVLLSTCIPHLQRWAYGLFMPVTPSLDYVSKCLDLLMVAVCV